MWVSAELFPLSSQNPIRIQLSIEFQLDSNWKVEIHWNPIGKCDKNHTGIDDRCMSSWFCSHPVGSDLRDQEWMTDPYQDRPSSNLTISP